MSSPPARSGRPTGEARLSSAIRWRPGAASRSTIGRGGGAARAARKRGRAGRAGELGQDVGATPGRDLLDHVGAGAAGRARRGARARARQPRRSCRRSRRPPAAASRGRVAPPGALRAARSPRPASMVSAARSIPSSIWPTTPATSSAAPALSRTTSRRMPGSPRRTASVIRAFSSGEPPDSRAVAARLNPSAAASITCRSTVSPATMYATPLPSSGSSSTPSPWMTNVRSVPRRRTTSAIRAAHGRIADPEQLAPRPGRVGQRAEQVERRPHADLAPGRAGVLHRRVEVRREQEREADLAERRARRRRVVVDPDPERVEDVGRAGPRGHRAVAVLGDRHAGRGRDQRRGRRDVERAAAVAAGPDDVDRAVGRLDADDALAHRQSRSRPARRRSRRASAGPSAARRAGPASPRRPSPRPSPPRASSIDRVPPSTIVASAARTCSLIGRPPRRLDRRVVSAMPAVANDPLASSSRDASPSPAWRRKLARRCGPSGVSTDSGWNWTPSSGRATCRMPITTRSTSLIAVTRSSGGSVAGSTASEW